MIFESPTILFRCDASRHVGYGHLMRSLSIANALREDYKYNIIFLVIEDQNAVDKLNKNGYKVIYKEINDYNSSKEYCLLSSTIKKIKPQILILDIRTNLTFSDLSKIKDQRLKIVTIDDSTDRRFAADLSFFPPVPQIDTLNWDGFSGQKYVGWEWVPIRPEFAQIRIPSSQTSNRNPLTPLRILLTMGGSDPAGLTLLAINALKKVECDLDVTIVLGLAFSKLQELRVILDDFQSQYTIKQDVDDIEILMRDSDLAIISFGMTAYELAVMGIPTIYYSLTSDHAISASAFQSSGFGLNLGCYKDLEFDKHVGLIRDFINTTMFNSQASTKPLKTISGNGAHNIAAVISKEVINLSLNIDINKH